MSTAILLLAHGSRVAEANDTAREIAAIVQQITGYSIVEVAFREQHQPHIQAGIESCVARGADRIVLIPYFLSAGAHVLEDLPEELEEARKRHPQVAMALGAPLGAHRKLAEIVVERIAQTLTATGWH